MIFDLFIILEYDHFILFSSAIFKISSALTVPSLFKSIMLNTDLIAYGESLVGY